MLQLETPVVFLIFNRPAVTKQVFEEIRRAQPKILLVVADGPRNSEEADLCAETRQIVDKIDWPCEVLRNYSEANLGCRERISSGITWAFQHVSEAIILEDDCLPDPTFFNFCGEMLEHYRNDPRVMIVCGNNFQDGIKRGEASYYFSRYFHIWGWATWRRTWQLYDSRIPDWPQQKAAGLIRKCSSSKSEQKFWERNFDQIHAGTFNAWGLQLIYAGWKAGGLSIIPNINLISNIGFGSDATHTKGINRFANMPTGKIEKLIHPKFIAIDAEADRYSSEQLFSDPKPGYFYRLTKILKYLIRPIKRLSDFLIRFSFNKVR